MMGRSALDNSLRTYLNEDTSVIGGQSMSAFALSPVINRGAHRSGPVNWQQLSLRAFAPKIFVGSFQHGTNTLNVDLRILGPLGGR